MKYFFSVFPGNKVFGLIIICMLSGIIVKAQFVGVSDLSTFSPQSLFHIYKNSSGAMTLMQLTNGTTGSGSGVGLTVDVLDASFNLNINNRYASYLSFSTSGTQRMTILSGGNVGIGTTNPSVKLHVVGDEYVSRILTTGNNTVNTADPKAADIVIGSDAGTRHDASIMWWSSSSASRISNTSDVFYLSTWNTSSSNVALAATVGSSSYFQGNLGVGTVSPSYRLDVQGGEPECGNIIWY